MDNLKKYRLLDLFDEIKEVEAMIRLHLDDPTSMMLEQYKYKKDKLTGFLIGELVKPEVRSEESILIIKLMIEIFYPYLKNEAKADIIIRS